MKIPEFRRSKLLKLGTIFVASLLLIFMLLPVGQLFSNGTCSWTGTWDTDYGIMKLTQNGNNVTGSYHYQGDWWPINGTVVLDELSGTWVDPYDTGPFEFTMAADCNSFTGDWWRGDGSGPLGWDGTRVKSKDNKVAEPQPWVRDHQMQCWQVWINQDNAFEFVFVWEYYNNNWVKIYDMAGNEVFSIDMPKGGAHFTADLPDGMYNVKTFHEYGHILQEFVIGKP